MACSKLRGTRKKTRSTKGRRLTPAERRARATECKHEKFRYRNRGTEAVCLNCGSVQKVQGFGMNIEVVESWKLEVEDSEEHPPTCGCSVCHLKRQDDSS